MNTKQAFIHELNPLLREAEKAIRANDVDTAQRVSLEVLQLVDSYSRKLSKKQLREALNNPIANQIAKGLGVLPR